MKEETIKVNGVTYTLWCSFPFIDKSDAYDYLRPDVDRGIRGLTVVRATDGYYYCVQSKALM